MDFTTKTLILWPLPAVLAFEIESAASVGPLTRLTHTHTQGNPKDSTVRQSRKCATRAKAEGSESWRAMAKVAKATNEWPGALVLKRSWICVVVVLRCRRLSFSFSLSCCRCRCRCRTGGIASHRLTSRSRSVDRPHPQTGERSNWAGNQETSATQPSQKYISQSVIAIVEC